MPKRRLIVEDTALDAIASTNFNNFKQNAEPVRFYRGDGEAKKPQRSNNAAVYFWAQPPNEERGRLVRNGSNHATVFLGRNLFAGSADVSSAGQVQTTQMKEIKLNLAVAA